MLRIHQEFVLDLHRGVHMTQLTANTEYASVHCQLMEDLCTLKMDQGSGCIVEFPLTAVSKVYRIVKQNEKWYSTGAMDHNAHNDGANTEHIVVVEFLRRKIAFVFTEVEAAQSFLMCMELLIRRAQEFGDSEPSDTPHIKNAIATPNR